MKVKFEAELLPNGMWKVTAKWTWLGERKSFCVYAVLLVEAMTKAERKLKDEWSHQKIS